jgi:hypothetical protein
MIIQGRRLAEAVQSIWRSNSYSWILRDIPSLPIELLVGSSTDYQEDDICLVQSIIKEASSWCLPRFIPFLGSGGY